MELRVAQVIGGLRIGGAERQFVNLINALSCEFRAAIFIGNRPADESFQGELDPGVEQHFVRVRRRSFPVGVTRLASTLRKLRVNVVHTHMFGANLYGTLAARLAGVPAIVTSEHGENPWKGPWHRWLERSVISPIVDRRLCVSQRILDFRRDRDGVPDSKLKLMANGTLLPVLSYGRPRRDVPVIGSVGRFIPAKDFPGLIQAAALLRDRGYRFELCIVGDGPEANAVRNCISKFRLEDFVRLPGMVTDMGRWYRQFDIFVSSSIREGQPVALLEAMAYSLPVVATDVGATCSTVGHNEGGLIVAPSDVTALANALGQLLENPALKQTLGQKGRMRVEREFSIEAVSEQITQCYRNILARKAR